MDLIPVGNLDHETKTSYELLLIASNQPVDGSKDVAVQSSSVKLVITVLDKNEFKPKFDKEVTFHRAHFHVVINKPLFWACNQHNYYAHTVLQGQHIWFT